jgi:hypothetical protein
MIETLRWAAHLGRPPIHPTRTSRRRSRETGFADVNRAVPVRRRQSCASTAAIIAELLRSAWNCGAVRDVFRTGQTLRIESTNRPPPTRFIMCRPERRAATRSRMRIAARLADITFDSHGEFRPIRVTDFPAAPQVKETRNRYRLSLLAFLATQSRFGPITANARQQRMNSHTCGMDGGYESLKTLGASPSGNRRLFPRGKSHWLVRARRRMAGRHPVRALQRWRPG